MESRVLVELHYLLALDKTGLFPPLTPREIKKIEKHIDSFSEKDYLAIKAIEKTLNHDVKELFYTKLNQLLHAEVPRPF